MRTSRDSRSGALLDQTKRPRDR
eukprot:UN06886